MAKRCKLCNGPLTPDISKKWSSKYCCPECCIADHDNLEPHSCIEFPDSVYDQELKDEKENVYGFTKEELESEDYGNLGIAETE